MPKKKSELMLANEHASVALASVVYDPGEEDLLVAAFTVATSIDLLVAIKAQLEKNGRNRLRDAGFGYVAVGLDL